jgi:hypothetical protein
MDGAGEIIPTRSNVIPFMRDRLTNVMSGMGTTADKRVFSRYAFIPLAPEQAEAGYRSSWLVRKIVDIPPLDMTRAWRDWQADATTSRSSRPRKSGSSSRKVPAGADPGAALRRRRADPWHERRGSDAAAQARCDEARRPDLRPRLSRWQLSHGR